MRRILLSPLAAITMTILLMAPACTMFTEPPPEEDEPTFAPGEYGGEPLPGTEHLSNVKPSPSGGRFALVRKRTPGKPSDPRNQLWIVDEDGTNPRLVGVNILGADWHPDGNRVAVTVATGIDSYVYTINLSTMETTQWTGKSNQRLSLPVVSGGDWFQNGRDILVFVDQKAYQQPFARGIYTIDTQDTVTTGPHLKLMQAAYLGKNDEYVFGRKFYPADSLRSGNYARYNLKTNEWKWITDVSRDSIYKVGGIIPNPSRSIVVQSRPLGNAPQLFLMNTDGKEIRRITQLGGDNPRWSPNGSSFVFRRDVHRGEGARYVPFRFDLETMEAEPLWPARPDSVPDFPDLSTQSLNKIAPRR